MKTRRRRAVAAMLAVLVAAGAAVIVVPKAVEASVPAPLVGVLRWADATASSLRARTITVRARTEQLEQRAGCAAFRSRVRVQETPAAVRILVTGVYTPYPPGTACAASLAVTRDVRVHLGSALGSRAVVDASGGRRHRVLLLDRTPAPGAVPAGFRAKEVSWDESTGTVHRWWRRSRPAGQIELYALPTRDADRVTPALPQEEAPATIGGRRATVTRDVDPQLVQTQVRWEPQPGRTLVLQVLDQSGDPPTPAEVVALARTVR